MTESKLSIVERQVDDVTVLILTGKILLGDGGGWLTVKER